MYSLRSIAAIGKLTTPVFSYTSRLASMLVRGRSSAGTYIGTRGLLSGASYTPAKPGDILTLFHRPTRGVAGELSETGGSR